MGALSSEPLEVRDKRKHKTAWKQTTIAKYPQRALSNGRRNDVNLRVVENPVESVTNCKELSPDIEFTISINKSI
jgi:hypothetical protein